MEKKGFRLDVKRETLSDDGTFEGHASVFGNIDSYGDIVDKGAFTKTLKEGKEFPMLFNHNMNEVLGKIEAKQDRAGLYVKGIFELGVKRAEEIYLLLKSGAIKGLSIGYSTIRKDTEKIKDQFIRIIKELKLFEVSVVVFPANTLANVEAVKMMDELIEEIKERKDDEEFKKQVLSLFSAPENSSTHLEQPKYSVEFLKKLQEVYK
jgi:HK97 family phage prohead protease